MVGNRKQHGLSMVGFLLTLSLLGFFAFITMRLFPVYTEFYSVKSDMEGLRNEPNARGLSPEQLRNLLFRRFQISYVESVKPTDVTFDRNRGYNMNVVYEVRRPLMGNLDFVAKFSHTVNFEQ